MAGWVGLTGGGVTGGTTTTGGVTGGTTGATGRSPLLLPLPPPHALKATASAPASTFLLKTT
ncbi:hypothetical protein D9M71_398830 [compost metagenome]